jgi:hypothetical protein
MVWIAASLLFCAQLYFVYNVEVAVNFLTGYVIEESLSLDNLFVILLTFESFRIQKADQHKVLFWGILSAIILRGACIFAGLALIQRFEWMLHSNRGRGGRRGRGHARCAPLCSRGRCFGFFLLVDFAGRPHHLRLHAQRCITKETTSTAMQKEAARRRKAALPRAWGPMVCCYA